LRGCQPTPKIDRSLKAIFNIKGGVRISDIGHLIDTKSKKFGCKVIKNLTGHGIGRSFHEEPGEIANYRDRFNQTRFKKNSVLAMRHLYQQNQHLPKP